MEQPLCEHCHVLLCKRCVSNGVGPAQWLLNWVFSRAVVVVFDAGDGDGAAHA